MCVRDNIRLGPISEFLDLDFIDNPAGFRCDRSAALQNALNTDNGLIKNAGFIGNPPHTLHKNSQGVGAAFVHQRSRHDHVIHEMTGQKPVIGMDIGFCLNQSQAVSSADRVQIDNAVDQFQAASGKSERTGQGDSRKGLTETSGRIAAAKRF